MAFPPGSPTIKELCDATAIAERWAQSHGRPCNIVTAHYHSGTPWTVWVYHGNGFPSWLSIDVERGAANQLDCSHRHESEPEPPPAHPGEPAASKIARCPVSPAEALEFAAALVGVETEDKRDPELILHVSDLRWEIYFIPKSWSRSSIYLRVEIDAATRRPTLNRHDVRERPL